MSSYEFGPKQRSTLGHLVGAARKGEWIAHNDLGADIDPRLNNAVFPILKRIRGDDRSSPIQLVGTGFFITTNGIFVTAKHVLGDVIDASGLQSHELFMIHFMPEQEYFLRPIIWAWNHSSADLSIGIAAPMHHKKTKVQLTNLIMKLTTTLPPTGTRLGTYAYPNTDIRGEGTKHVINLSPEVYDGILVESHLAGRDSVLMPWPCSRTSIHLHGGASGGPVFDELTGRVFAINSKSFEGATDVSYVTHIGPLLDGFCDNVCLSPGAPAQRVLIRDLARLGHIIFDPPQ